MITSIRSSSVKTGIELALITALVGGVSVYLNAYALIVLGVAAMAAIASRHSRPATATAAA